MILNLLAAFPLFDRSALFAIVRSPKKDSFIQHFNWLQHNMCLSLMLNLFNWISFYLIKQNHFYGNSCWSVHAHEMPIFMRFDANIFIYSPSKICFIICKCEISPNQFFLTIDQAKVYVMKWAIDFETLLMQIDWMEMYDPKINQTINGFFFDDLFFFYFNFALK